MPIRPRIPIRPKRESFWKHWTLWIWFALPVFLILGAVLLWKSGHWLVRESHFEKASWAIVLAGESRDCERTDEAIRLYKAGRIDTVVLSACRVYKTRYASEFLLDYMVGEGIPKGNIFEFRQDAYSTVEEAQLLIRQFRYQNLDTVLIITSNYHSARTYYIFNKLAQGYPHIMVHAADFHTFNPASWWSNRESRKHWLGEWLKTLFTYYEVWRTGPEKGKADFQNLVPDIWGHSTLSPIVPDSIPLASANDSSSSKSGIDTLLADSTNSLSVDTAHTPTLPTVPAESVDTTFPGASLVPAEKPSQSNAAKSPQANSSQNKSPTTKSTSQKLSTSTQSKLTQSNSTPSKLKESSPSTQAKVSSNKNAISKSTGNKAAESKATKKNQKK